MNIRPFLFFLLFSASFARASDSLRIALPKIVYQRGDSLDFSCTLPYFAASNLSSATLNVWIEDLDKTKRWKFRYPIINGVVDAGLAIANTIPAGKYAVTFLVQRGFFKIYGEIKDHQKKDTALYYMMVQKNDPRNNYLDITKVTPEGSFRLKSTLFADSAFFIFTPAKKVKSNSLSVHIETPLDSVFTPVLMETKFIMVGSPDINNYSGATDTNRYRFQLQPQDGLGYLPNVTVTTHTRKKIEQYDEEYSTGLFRNTDAIIFDGLESEEIANSSSTLVYLMTRVPGLSIEKDEEGRDIAKWRKERVELYIDEFRVNANDFDLVTPADIAMIKVYRPPARLSALSGAAGAIAIYTKRGNYLQGNSKRHSFIVKGYTAVDAVWQ